MPCVPCEICSMGTLGRLCVHSHSSLSACPGAPEVTWSSFSWHTGQQAVRPFLRQLRHVRTSCRQCWLEQSLYWSHRVPQYLHAGRREKKKTTKHVKTHTAPSDPHAESFLWHQEAEISFKWLSCCLPALLSKNILHFQASDFNVKKKKKKVTLEQGKSYCFL